MLEMKNISKRFGEKEALTNVSLTLERGEVLAIIGPSGSGKSTLLRIAAFLERADGGELSYLGRRAAEDSGNGSVYAGKRQLAACRASFGMVFQSFELFPHMSVMRNLTDAQITVKGTPKDEAREKAESLLEKVGLSDKAASYPCELSGGEKQRVCIARALAMEPRMLFFDEPTSALDPRNSRNILSTMRVLAEGGMTMLVVTHEIPFARDVADRVILLEAGEIACEGTADILRDESKGRLSKFLTGEEVCANI